MLLLAIGVWPLYAGLLYVELLYAGLLYVPPPVPICVTSVRGFFFGVLVMGMLSSDVMSWTLVRILVFSLSIWLCSCIACCFITGRSPDRTSWVPPWELQKHGQEGGLTMIGAGVGAGAGAGISFCSSSLGRSVEREPLVVPASAETEQTVVVLLVVRRRFVCPHLSV